LVYKPILKDEFALRIRNGFDIIESKIKNLIIFSLAKLAESLDPEMGKHLHRIQLYSKTIAIALKNMKNSYRNFIY